MDLSAYKNSVSNIKDILRTDSIYGNKPILIRTRNETSTGGYNGIYDIGNNETSYINTILYGIQEMVPKGYENRYNDISLEENGDIKFTLSVQDAETLISALRDNDKNVYIDSVLEDETIISIGKEIELVSYSNCLLELETIFYLNIKG